MPTFLRFIGIDYSGARTPTDSLPGLRVYLAEGDAPPAEVRPPSGARKHWTRRGIAEWLVEQLRDGPPALVGIDHGFSFPLQYFQKYALPPDWPIFLDDFHRHWPTDEDATSVDFVREGRIGNGAARMGDRRWRRLCEIRAGAAKSVFLFDVQGSVAKSTHAGLPWLRHLRQQLGARVHFWPFDGWDAPPGRSLIAEVYPSLWRSQWPNDGRTPDQHDAYVVTAWLQHTARDGALDTFLHPALSPEERAIAEIEGWILGVK
ncbi:MAG: hypothetical protein RMN52_08705 [Anaerolineae bacterium]|nr:hypothetical protein [Candidatus Roseilinea sp.]MDW8450071.1 hypothetical protein [Anaerolineae bacterium]